jgi:hypothetical protein
MLVQDPQTGHFHEVPNYNVAGYAGYEGYGEYDGYGWYGGYGEEPPPQMPPGPDPQMPPVPPPPPPEDPANMYPDGYPYPAPPPPPPPMPWHYWMRQWGWNPLQALRRRRYWPRSRQRSAWPGRGGVWARHRTGWPGRAGWARHGARPRSPLMAAARRVFARPARGHVRDHRRR